MTPKEKAEDLFQFYLPFVESSNLEEIKNRCKKCSLIAVNEILDAIVIINEYDFEPINEYWQEVKIEIEKL